MAKTVQLCLDRFMNGPICQNPSESEFHQAVYEAADAMVSWGACKKDYQIRIRICVNLENCVLIVNIFQV